MNKTHTILILLMIFSVSSVHFISAQESSLNIQRFLDKYKNDGNITEAVREALIDCKKKKAKKLVFPKGQYYFSAERASEKYSFISNNDEGLKRYAFDLTELHDFEIDGQGSTFIFKGFICPFLIEKANNIKIHDITIDYERTFHSEGKILNVNNEYIDVSFDNNNPYQITNNRLTFIDADKTKYPWYGLLEFDSNRKETAYKAYDYWMESDIPVKDLGNGKVRVEFPGIKATVGNIMVFGAGHRLVPAFSITDSKNINLNTINIYHCGGMGVICQKSENIHLEKINVIPTPGSNRMVSITADATHFSNCSGKISIIDCVFKNQKDDATNIHGIYYKISRILSSNELEIELIHRQQYGFDYLKEGMKIEFVDAPSLNTYAESKIKSITKINKQFSKISLTKPLSEKVKINDVVASTNSYPEVHIKGCNFGNNRARGLLLGSRGKTVIENNTFHIAGTSILMEGDARFWYEQAGVRNLIIRNNTFDNCNYGAWGTGCISIGSNIEPNVRANSRYNKNIVIENNVFKIFSAPILTLYSVDNASFKDNQIIKTDTYPSTVSSDTDLFVIENCTNVDIVK